MKYKVSENGRSMVEMMGYMAVMLALITMIGRIVTNAFDEYKYSKASLQLTDLADAIARAAAVEPNYSDIVKMVNGTHEDAAKNQQGLKIIPGTFRLVGRKILHAFGGEVKVDLPPSEIGGNDKFAIKMEGLKKRQCVEMAMKDWSKNQNVDLYAVIINKTNYWYWPVYSGEVDNVLPVTRVKLTGTGEVGSTAQCSKEKDNDIIWVFN